VGGEGEVEDLEKEFGCEGGNWRCFGLMCAGSEDAVVRSRISAWTFRVHDLERDNERVKKTMRGQHTYLHRYEGNSRIRWRNGIRVNRE